MAIKIIGSTSGAELETDANKNVYVRRGLTEYGAAGGGYSVAGATSAVVAAALAANTTLMAMRFNPASARRAYITRMYVAFSPATLGASGGVAGTLGLQKFTTATPTGGTARTPLRKNASTGSGTDMTDVRDSNAALTVTGVAFAEYVAMSLVPLFVSSAGGFLWQWSAENAGEPVVLNAGDGLCLRTVVAMAATQTWLYAYTFDWFER